MLIDVEKTYHPDVCNFYFNSDVLGADKAEYANLQTKNVSVLLESILAIGGIVEVLLTRDMLYVKKDSGVDFEELTGQILALVDEFDFSYFKDFDFSKQDKTGLINAVVESQIRPFLKADGGDIKILRADDGILYVKLTGHCSGCVHAKQTLKNVVESYIKKYVPEIKAVSGEDDA